MSRRSRYTVIAIALLFAGSAFAGFTRDTTTEEEGDLVGNDHGPIVDPTPDPNPDDLVEEGRGLDPADDLVLDDGRGFDGVDDVKGNGDGGGQVILTAATPAVGDTHLSAYRPFEWWASPVAPHVSLRMYADDLYFPVLAIHYTAQPGFSYTVEFCGAATYDLDTRGTFIDLDGDEIYGAANASLGEGDWCGARILMGGSPDGDPTSHVVELSFGVAPSSDWAEVTIDEVHLIATPLE